MKYVLLSMTMLMGLTTASFANACNTGSNADAADKAKTTSTDDRVNADKRTTTADQE